MNESGRQSCSREISGECFADFNACGQLDQTIFQAIFYNFDLLIFEEVVVRLNILEPELSSDHFRQNFGEFMLYVQRCLSSLRTMPISNCEQVLVSQIIDVWIEQIHILVHFREIVLLTAYHTNSGVVHHHVVLVEQLVVRPAQSCIILVHLSLRHFVILRISGFRKSLGQSRGLFKLLFSREQLGKDVILKSFHQFGLSP